MGIDEIFVGEGVIVCNGEDGHFDTDEGICEAERDVFGVFVRSELFDDVGGDEDGDCDGLPE